jgi:hypothetical protein
MVNAQNPNKGTLEACITSDSLIDVETQQKTFKLFDSNFSQTLFDTNLSHGVGLGLHTTKNLTTWMGGEISISSDIRKGTVVRIAVPTDIEKVSRQSLAHGVSMSSGLFSYQSRDSNCLMAGMMGSSPLQKPRNNNSHLQIMRQNKSTSYRKLIELKISENKLIGSPISKKHKTSKNYRESRKPAFKLSKSRPVQQKPISVS